MSDRKGKRKKAVEEEVLPAPLTEEQAKGVAFSLGAALRHQVGHLNPYQLSSVGASFDLALQGATYQEISRIGSAAPEPGEPSSSSKKKKSS